jgi:hypothetical protein
MKAKSRKTELANVNIDQLPQRDEGGYIDHFNIDGSPWVRAMVVKEVLRACPQPSPLSWRQIKLIR